MQYAIHALLFAPGNRVGVDWFSLLDAMGTPQFDDVLHQFLSTLIGLDTSAPPCAPTLSGLSWTAPLELSQRLAGTAGALTAIVHKHMETLDGGRDQQKAEPLSCLATIERCLAERTCLPRRELEVCSRILYGMSSAGIAIDLDLCETTVKTYRKRAYQRLSIGCERELITWYLRTWNSTQRVGKHLSCI
ncbi:LuxR family transcriptional regulator [Caenimonas soli]|uniref:LuxR family transcriptional regulator n=1 Tax=Caenimonas soli TaxID=2735555 RepID=UPI001557F41B|nr:helix-turn-helix transcriptional regulator [Caenimonas soli]NPC58169.1 helix-turn-helix transcriptional regulator [Caenimonas soli]